MATNFHYKCNSWWFNYITGERIMACPFTIKEKKIVLSFVSLAY